MYSIYSVYYAYTNIGLLDEKKQINPKIENKSDENEKKEEKSDGKKKTKTMLLMMTMMWNSK